MKDKIILRIHIKFNKFNKKEQNLLKNENQENKEN